MSFSITWFDIPEDYLTEYKCRFTDNYNYSNYIDTIASLSQVHSYFNGYDLVDNIFSDEELRNWIKGINVVIDYSRFKSIVDKVSIR